MFNLIGKFLVQILWEAQLTWDTVSLPLFVNEILLPCLASII